MLAIEARQILCQSLSVEPPCPEEMLGSMAAIPLPKRLWLPSSKDSPIDPLQLRLFDEFAIEVPVARWGTPEQRCLRVSAHAHNSRDQFDYLAAALQKLTI